MTNGERIKFCIAIPFYWLRKITMPPCEEEDYNHYLTIIWPIFGVPILKSLIVLRWPWEEATLWTWLTFLIVDVVWIVFWIFFGTTGKKSSEEDGEG